MTSGTGISNQTLYIKEKRVSIVYMKEQKFIIDRIEEDYVILEDENHNIISKNINSFCIKPNEGDVVIINENNLPKVNIEATNKRKKEISILMKGMWEE